MGNSGAGEEGIVWTSDQRRAVETLDRGVAVSAAAGSGKTAVLAERCVHLICDAPPGRRCGVDELLVVTFTESAAAEMRSRIRERLRRRAAERPGDSELHLQLPLLDTAHIGTLHSFCLWLIRRWFSDIGIDAGATVMDADAARLLKVQVLDEEFERRYAAEDDAGRAFRRLVDDYGLGNDRDIRSTVLRLAEMLESRTEPREWLDAARRRYSDGVAGTARSLTAALRAELTLQAEHVRHVADGMDGVDAAVLFHRDLVARYGRQVDRWKEAIERIENRPATGDDGVRELGELLAEINAYSMDARGVPRGKVDDALSAARKDASDVRGRVRQIFEKRLRSRFARFTTAELERDLQRVAPYAATITQLVESFRECYDIAKRRNDVLDFADLERLAYDLLRREEIAGTVRRQFRHVLVDEYQDINRLQAELIRAASLGGGSIVPTNLFTVGDVKQSIYRFRSAEPRVFLNRMDAAQNNTERVSLRENFRGRPKVLEGINVLFRALMRGTIGDFEYDDGHALRPGRHFVDGRAGPVTELHLLDRRFPPSDGGESEDEFRTDDDEGGGGGESTDGDAKPPVYVDPHDPAEWAVIEREAFVIAERLRRLQSGELRLDGGRPVGFSDVAVLMRTGIHTADALVSFLARFGIPAYSASPGRILHTPEVRDVRALLEVIDNLQQDIPLAAVLRSPLLGDPLSEPELYALREFSREVPFHRAVALYTRNGRDAALRSAVTGKLDRIRRYRRATRLKSFPDALWEMIEGSGYWAFVGGLREGRQRRTHLLRFHEHARRFDAYRRHGLHRFLEYLDSLESDDRDVAGAGTTEESADAVRVMSVHASKGLEFPVVFLADIGRRFNLTDSRGRIIMDRDVGVGMNVVDRDALIEYPTVVHRLAAAEIEWQTRSEELRILYVAMTRAREKLILVGSAPATEIEQARRRATMRRGVTGLDIAAGRSFLDWTVPVLAAQPAEVVAWDAEPAEETLFHVRTYSAEAMGDWRMPPDASARRSPLLEAAGRLRPLPPDEPTSPMPIWAEEVIARVGFHYPHLEAASVPSVVAASDVRHAFDPPFDTDEAVYLPSPAAEAGVSIPRREREDSRRRGTVTHRVLQHLEHAGVHRGQTVHLQVDAFIARGLLAPDDRAHVDFDGIAWFCGTPLGRRAGEAGACFRREFMFLAGRPATEMDATLRPDMDDRVLVRGIVDGILPGPEGLELIDYKTDHVTAAEAGIRAGRYRSSMHLYAESIEALFRRPVIHAWLVFLRPRVIMDVRTASVPGIEPSGTP